ncbi:50S ribosomal protein L18 [Candidatus Dependentiae bacterium]|nr:MAG: 50S ribosomal protein L18 [Candidatus Dependentiae bacterium]
MASSKKDLIRKKRRKLRVRGTYGLGDQTKPRISVFRSLKHMYAQIIDDVRGVTIVSCSTLSLDKVSGDKKAQAYLVGKELARLAQAKGVQKAFLDRGSSRYLGRVASLAEGLREGGIII